MRFQPFFNRFPKKGVVNGAARVCSFRVHVDGTERNGTDGWMDRIDRSIDATAHDDARDDDARLDGGEDTDATDDASRIDGRKKDARDDDGDARVGWAEKRRGS